MWLWQHKDWPNFRYDQQQLDQLVYNYGKYAAAMHSHLAETENEDRLNILLDCLVEEAMSTSQIEGETLTVVEVRSSIKQQLGITKQLDMKAGLKEQGIANLLTENRKSFNEALTQAILFHWHELVMQGANPYTVFEIGMWRSSAEPMQIISGPLGNHRVHFEAPPAKKIAKEMRQFIDWFNQTREDKLIGPIRAGLAHLYFETIHPFQDGNGRIGRVLSEKILAQDLGQPILFSISRAIFQNRNEYYQELSYASSHDMDVTRWLNYFLKMLIEAQYSSWQIIEFVLRKTKFWKIHQQQLSERQTSVLQRMLKEGAAGFEGGINAKKYIKLTGVSKATATRDLSDMVEKNALIKLPEQGKNTRYEIKLPHLNYNPFEQY